MFLINQQLAPWVFYVAYDPGSHLAPRLALLCQTRYDLHPTSVVCLAERYYDAILGDFLPLVDMGTRPRETTYTTGDLADLKGGLLSTCKQLGHHNVSGLPDYSGI